MNPCHDGYEHDFGDSWTCSRCWLFLPCRTGHKWVNGGRGDYCFACGATNRQRKGARVRMPQNGTPLRGKALTLAEISGDVCSYCDQELTDQTRTLDHVIPKSKGGADNLSNLVLACRECNAKKADRITW